LQKYELWFDRLTTTGKGGSTGSPRPGKVVRQAHHDRERWFDRLTTNGKGGSTGSPRPGKMVRQAHHEWNNQDTVHPEPRACRTVEGSFWSFARGSVDLEM